MSAWGDKRGFAPAAAPPPPAAPADADDDYTRVAFGAGRPTLERGASAGSYGGGGAGGGGGSTFRDGWVRSGPVSPAGGGLDSPTVRKRESPPPPPRRSRASSAAVPRAASRVTPSTRAPPITAPIPPSPPRLPPHPLPPTTAAVTRFSRSELLEMYAPSLQPPTLAATEGITTRDSLAPTLWNTPADPVVRVPRRAGEGVCACVGG